MNISKINVNGTSYDIADTKNTAGSTDSSNKLFLIGATSQAANPQTYSQDTAYVGTDGHLYSNNKKVLNVAGGVLESLNGITSTANSSTKVFPSESALSQSPIPKYLWHDLFAFCRTEVPLYYTTSDNSTWTAATTSKLPFNQKDDGSVVYIINATGRTGSRWQWNNTLRWSSAKWLVIGFRYQNNPAIMNVLVETSSDGTTWTTRHSTAGISCGAEPVWFYLEDFGSDSKLRLTITKNTSDTTNTATIGCIKLLSTRWGSQGKGSEYEYPYDWDANGNILSISAGNRDLGATDNYWKNLYVTNINGVAVGSSPKFTDTTYESKSAASGGSDVSLVTTGEKYTWNNKQNKVAKLGSTTKPVYTSAAGTFAECSTYAGGTAVTLNGTSKAANTASFYAPTSAGTNGLILTSNGSGAPSWTAAPISIEYTAIDQAITDINATLAQNALVKVQQTLTSSEKTQVLTNLGISTTIDNALVKTSQSLSSSEKTQVLTNLGIASTQIRNVTVSTADPTSNDGNDGDVWLVYET